MVDSTIHEVDRVPEYLFCTRVAVCNITKKNSVRYLDLAYFQPQPADALPATILISVGLKNVGRIILCNIKDANVVSVALAVLYLLSLYYVILLYEDELNNTQS